MSRANLSPEEWHAALYPLWREMRRIEEGTCHHPKKALTRRICTNGQIRYMAQCPDCGKTSRRSLKQHIGAAMNPPPPLYADGLHEKVLSDRYARLRPAKSAFYRAYDEYLLSPAWAEKRAQCLSTTSGICLHCGAPARQAHHVIYAQVGDECPEDLVPLCEPCHTEIHATAKSEIFPEVFL
jgi:hypothetical protein